MIGETAGETKSNATDSAKQGVQMGKDGYPVIWMKFSGDDTKIEMKPYRASFVRAAMLVTEARQEAQLQVSTNVFKPSVVRNSTNAGSHSSAFYRVSNLDQRLMPPNL
jgi:hypothetical protein